MLTQLRIFILVKLVYDPTIKLPRLKSGTPLKKTVMALLNVGRQLLMEVQCASNFFSIEYIVIFKGKVQGMSKFLSIFIKPKSKYSPTKH